MFWFGTLAALSAAAVACSHSKREWYPITKPLPIALLIYVMIYNYHRTTFLQGIFLGLICGFIGDLLLLKDSQPSWFISGLVAFLLGHVGYTHSFLMADWVLPPLFTVGYAIVCVAYSVFVIYKLFRKKKN